MRASAIPACSSNNVACISIRFTRYGEEFLEFTLGHLQLTGVEMLARGLGLGDDVDQDARQSIMYLVVEAIAFFQDRQQWQGITRRHCYLGSTTRSACMEGRCAPQAILKMPALSAVKVTRVSWPRLTTALTL